MSAPASQPFDPPRPEPSQRPDRGAALALLGLVTALAVAHAAWIGPLFPVDDAYITAHNARALVAGTDPNFPGVSPFQGATSAIHLVAVALFALVLPPAWALWAVAWLAIALYAAGTLRLARAWNLGRWPAGALVALALLAGRVPHQLLNGLETGLTLAALTWTLALASEPAPRRRWVLPLLAAQLPFLRPELAAFAPLPLVARALSDARRDGRAAWRGLARDAGVFAAGALPWIGLSLATLGAPFPSTAAAKRLFFAEGCLPTETRLKWVEQSIALFARTLGPLALAVFALPFSWLGAAGALFAAAFVAAYFVHFPGALGHYEQRYLYVLVPLLLFAVATLLAAPRRALRLCGNALLAVALAGAAIQAPGFWQHYRATLRFTGDELDGVARWCREYLPPDATLLVHDIGYISYATPFRLVDFVGLKSPAAREAHRRWTWPACGGMGRSAAVAAIAADARPGYLVMLQGWDGVYQFTAGLRALGWGLVPVRPEGDYRVYRLVPPPSSSPPPPPPPGTGPP
jgi:hypothetical protein